MEAAKADDSSTHIEEKIRRGLDLEKKESRELSYKLAVKLLDLMLKNGFLLPEEYEKIDALNRLTFKPELSKVYAESTRYPAKIVVLCGANRRGNFKEGISEDGGKGK